MVGDEKVEQGRYGTGGTRGEGLRADWMVGNARVGRVGDGRRCEGR